MSKLVGNIQTIVTYLDERFPIIPVLLFSFGYAGLAIGIVPQQNIWLFKWKLYTIRLVLFSSIFIFFLLRQRVVDEFKDFAHDLKNFPDRPVPRGLISKKQLIALGIFALIGEFISVFLLGIKAAIAYTPVFLYSLLLGKEFFVSRWLNRHFSFYFVIHEVIFVLFAIFFINTLTHSQPMLDWRQTLLIIAVLTVAPINIEIIRKFAPRYDKMGKVVKDSYSVVWGRKTTLFFLMGITTLIGFACMILKNSLYFLIYSLVAVTAFLLLRNNDKLVVGIGAISYLGFALLANLIW